MVIIDTWCSVPSGILQPKIENTETSHWTVYEWTPPNHYEVNTVSSLQKGKEGYSVWSVLPMSESHSPNIDFSWMTDSKAISSSPW